MDKNFIIGMVLIFLILFGWQTLSHRGDQAKNPAVPSDQEAKTDAASASPSPAQADKAAQTTPAQAAALTASTEDKIPATDVPALPPVDVKGENFSAQFTNVGGRIQSWRLEKFNDKAGSAGKPLEMVSLPESGKFPMATAWAGSGPVVTENDNYEIESRTPEKIVFARTDPAGFRISKTFEPDYKNYTVKMTFEIQSTGSASAQGRLSVFNYREMIIKKSSFFRPNLDITSFLAYVGGDLSKTSIDKAAGKSFPGNVIWAGFENIYFLSALAPVVTETAQAQVTAPKAANEPVAAAVTMPDTLIAPGGKAAFEFYAYFGPKAEASLIPAGHNFDQAVDFGWFTVIAKMLVRFLQLLNKWTGNWGVAIIVTTFLIKIVTLPLTQKSYKSMKSMSIIQPEMAKLREKYKDDRDKLNQEMMALYKAHGVNPASGCWPMLIQLPIFLAFYRALYGTIELRHSPFMLWILDLSAPDPYYVLPIIMGVTMVITQKMTPSTADPTQAKIMMVMPIVFTFMFLNFPAGLVLYWLVNNILTIIQQMYMKRGDGTKKAPAAA
jgi:YidC/Oxa1 family membrane protein insertase